MKSCKQEIRGKVEFIHRIFEVISVKRLDFEQKIAATEIHIRTEDGFLLMGKLPESFSGELNLGDDVKLFAGVIVNSECWSETHKDYGFFKRPMNFEVLA